MADHSVKLSCADCGGILRLKKNDVLIARTKKMVGAGMVRDALRRLLDRLDKDGSAPKGLSLLILSDDQTIENIPEREMNRLGWYRKDQ